MANTMTMLEIRLSGLGLLHNSVTCSKHHCSSLVRDSFYVKRPSFFACVAKLGFFPEYTLSSGIEEYVEFVREIG